MQFNVNEIPPEGLDLSEEINAGSWDMETALIKFKKPLHVKAHVEREKDDIFVDIHVGGAAFEECSRCLAGFEAPVSLNRKFIYSAKNKTDIKLDPDIREELMIDYPMKPLCKPDCRGLCPVCGKNLNEGECGCNRSLKGWNK